MAITNQQLIDQYTELKQLEFAQTLIQNNPGLLLIIVYMLLAGNSGEGSSGNGLTQEETQEAVRDGVDASVVSTAANQLTAIGHLATLAGSILSGKSQVDVKTVTLPTTLRNGQVTITTAGTRVPLAGSSTTISSGVTVKSAATNTGLVYVGNSTVSSSNGFRLNAGETAFIEIDDLNKIYVDAAVNSSIVSYIGT